MALSLAGFGAALEEFLQANLPPSIEAQLTEEADDGWDIPTTMNYIVQQDGAVQANTEYPRIVIQVLESDRISEFPRAAAARQYMVAFTVIVSLNSFGQLDPARSPQENTARVRGIMASALDRLLARQAPDKTTVLSLGPIRTNIDAEGIVPDSTTVEAIFVC